MIMVKSFTDWLTDHRISVSEERSGDVSVIISDIGKMLFLEPKDGKIIDGDFSFIVSDAELDVLEKGSVRWILFEFGGKYYYSSLKRDKDRYGDTVFKPEFNDFKYIGNTTEPKITDYVHLGIHTEYDIMNGSGSCELWARKAKFMGCDAIGICDRNTLSGVLSFQTAAEKVGMKSVIGEDVTVAVGYDPSKDIQETFELKLYVLNQDGWRNLLQINKAINVDYDKYVPEDVLYSHGKGLACVIAKESEFNFYKDDRKRCLSLIDRYRKSFDRVYYQIDTVEYVGRQSFRKHLSNIDAYLCDYRKYVKPILINDSYYLDKEESGLRGMLNKVAGRAVSETVDQSFKSFQDTVSAYEEWFDDVPDLFETIMKGVRNAKDLSDSVVFSIDTGERKLPRFEVEDCEGLFFEEIGKGFEEHFGDLTKRERERYLRQIETECAVIVPNGLCDYFMILWDIVRWCHENGIATGPGRGSVCGSLVAYCLNITSVDPMKYGLLFERFLNETRIKGQMPDIDLDFPTQYRDRVKDYIKDKYGYDYTCSVATYTRMKLKTCIKDFARIKGMSFEYTNRLTKDIDDQIEYKWGDLIEYASKSKQLFKFVQDNPDLVHLCKYALFQAKAESVHPSAVIIVPKHTSDGRDIDIWEWMPVKKIDGMLVSEWEGKYVANSGFLKEDILGLNQIDKFSSILSFIKKDTGEDVDVNSIPFDDREVFRYFRKGWNEDVFQIGTTGLTGYCKQVQPTCLDDLIAMIALFRPGPMDVDAHLDYVDIKAGKKKPNYDIGMKEITEDTYSLYVYQEQIMKAAVVGGLTQVDADNMRTAISKKKLDILNSFAEKFKKGYAELVSKNGVKDPEEYANRVWDKLLAFSGYGFNKCVCEDEVIYKFGYNKDSFVPTVGEMYRIMHGTEKGHYSLMKKYQKEGYGMCLSLSADGSRLKKNRIVGILPSGIRRVYKVTTESGKSIKVTMNHKFPTPEGERMLAELNVGDYLYCNDGYELIPYKKTGKRSDNYPQKGQKGFQKRVGSAKTVFLREYKERHWGCSCDMCGRMYSATFEVHHKDKNNENNTEDNLMWLCNSCHKKIHYDELMRTKIGEKGYLVGRERISSIEYCGERQTYDVEVSGDVSHTFLTTGGIVTSNSHAAAYTIMSYWSQWFKVNYPLEFWTTALQYSTEGEVPYRLAEMKKTGAEIEIRPPDINFSEANFTCDARQNRIFFSLMKIKGVGDVAVRNILETREKGGKFFSLEEFLSRVPGKVNKTVIVRLIVSGAFDLLEGVREPRERGILLRNYLDSRNDDYPEEYSGEESKTNAFWIMEQKRLTGYGEVDYGTMIRDAIPNRRVAEMYVNDSEFLASDNGKRVTVAGKLINHKERDIKSGKMCSVQLDCNNTIITVVLWPDVYARVTEPVENLRGAVVAINGIVKKDKFKNEKRLYGDSLTKLYIINVK